MTTGVSAISHAGVSAKRACVGVSNSAVQSSRRGTVALTNVLMISSFPMETRMCRPGCFKAFGRAISLPYKYLKASGGGPCRAGHP